MKFWCRWILAGICFLGLVRPGDLGAQITQFTYQGRLDSAGVPANGSYDLAFALYDNSVDGNQLGSTVTNLATLVSNGLFTVQLDFGDLFTDAVRWLDIGVRTNGGNADFTLLSPRQQITPIPYAITATHLNGALPSGQLSGTYSDTVTFNNPSNNFAGNGAGLVNISIDSVRGLAETTALLQSQIDDLASGTTNSPLNGGSITNLSLFDTNGAAAAIAATLVPTNRAYLPFTPEMFGGKADGVLLTKVVTTSGSAAILAVGAALSADDVGKTVCLYQDTTNISFLKATIVSVASTSNALISTTASVSGTFSMRYGTENQSALQSAINAATAANGQVQLQSGIYMLGGSLTNYAPSSYAALVIPTINSGTGMGTYLKGVMPTGIAPKHANNTANTAGSTIFVCSPSIGGGTNSNIIGYGALVGNFALGVLKIQDVTFVRPQNPDINGVNAPTGGSLLMDGVGFGVDFPYGSMGYASNGVYRPTVDGSNTNSAAAIILPFQNNNANSYINNCWVVGWPTGIAISEHARVLNSGIFYCGLGAQARGATGAFNTEDIVIRDTVFACGYQIAIPSSWHSVNANLQGLQFDSTRIDGGGTNSIYDPSMALRGYLTYFGLPLATDPTWSNIYVTTFNLASDFGPRTPAIYGLKNADLMLIPGNGNVTLAATNSPTLWWEGSPSYESQPNFYIQAHWGAQKMRLRNYLTNGWSFMNSTGKEILALNDAGMLTGNGAGLTNIPTKAVVGLAQLATAFQSQLAINTVTVIDQSNRLEQMAISSDTLKARVGQLEGTVTAAVTSNSAAYTALNRTSYSLNSRLGSVERVANKLTVMISILNAATNNIALSSLQWNINPSAFTNKDCVRIPVATNAGVVYYLTLSTNAP